MRRFGLAIGIAVAAGWLAGAGIAAGQGEDLGAPGEEQRRLEPPVGKWYVAVTYKLGPGEEHEGTAESEHPGMVRRRGGGKEEKAVTLAHTRKKP